MSLSQRQSDRCSAVQVRTGQSEVMFMKTAGCCRCCRILLVSSGLKGDAMICSTRWFWVATQRTINKQLVFKLWCYITVHLLTLSNLLKDKEEQDCVDLLFLLLGQFTIKSLLLCYHWGTCGEEETEASLFVRKWNLRVKRSAGQIITDQWF